MILIYVDKSWLESIGKVADLLAIEEASHHYISMMADSADVKSSFVEAKLLRRDAVAGEWFLPSSVPLAVVSGMFYLTRAETEKFGFRLPG